MSIYSNVTEQDLIILRKLAEQQKNQRALKTKNGISKQIHDIKLAQSLSALTKKLDTIIESTKQLGKLVKKSDVEDRNTQTPAIENTTIPHSLLDTLAFMKKINFFFKLVEKVKGKVFWIDVFIKPSRENLNSIKGVEYDLTPDIQTYSTKTKLITKFLVNVEKETVFEILENVGFYDNIAKIGLKAASMQDALIILPKDMDIIRNPLLPTIETISESDLEGQGLKNIIPLKIFDIYTRLEVLLGLKLSGHTDTLTEASNLIDELYRQGEIQTKQQSRNALDKLQT